MSIYANQDKKQEEFLRVQPDNIPDELKQMKRWVRWRYETKDDGKKTKVPYTAWFTKKASCHDSSTMTTFAAAYEQHITSNGQTQGVGFYLPDNGIVGIDLDKAFDDDGELYPWANDIISECDSYTERSPSGLGIRIFVRGKKPGTKCKCAIAGCHPKSAVEIYERVRFLTLTGNMWLTSSATIEERQDAIDAIYGRYFPIEPIEKANPSVSPAPTDLQLVIKVMCETDKWAKLWKGDWEGDYQSQSSADLALCGQLAYYLGGDKEKVRAAFSLSGLGQRPKWQRRKSYQDSTLALACERESYFDWSRWVPSNDADMVTAAISQPIESKPKPKKQRTYAIGERIGMVRPVWLINGLIRKNSVSVMFGESGSRKTWVAIAMGLSVSTGKPFLGKYSVKKGKVYYVISEGADDFEFRCEGWCRQYGVHPTADEFVYLPAAYDFNDDKSVAQVFDDLGERIQSADLIIIDTLSKNFSGDSDKNADMSKFVNRMEELRRHTGAHVQALHHTGWNNTHRERGGRALRDNVDTSIGVEKNDTTSRLTCCKQKLGHEFAEIPVAFDLMPLPEYDTEEEKVSVLVAKYDDDVSNRIEMVIKEVFSSGETMYQKDAALNVKNRWKTRWENEKPPGFNAIREVINNAPYLEQTNLGFRLKTQP